MRISVLALEGVFDTGFTSVLDALTTANKLAHATGMATPGFEITVVGVRPQVRTALGLQVPVRDIADAPRPDWVVVPALGSITAEQLVPALGQDDLFHALGALRRWRNAGARIAAPFQG